MPRIPTSPGPNRRPSAAGLVDIRESQLPLKMLAETFAEVSDTAARLRAEEISAQRGVVYSQKQAELVTRLGELRNGLSESDNIDGIVTDYDSGAGQIYNEVRGSISDRRVAQAFDEFAVKTIASGHVASLQVQRSRRKDQALAELPDILQQYESSILDAPTEEERQLLIRAGHQAIDLRSPYLTEVAQAKLRFDFDRSIDVDRAARIGEESPAYMMRLAGNKEKFFDTFQTFDETDRVKLLNKTRAEIGGRVASDLSIAVSRAETSDQISGLRERVESAYNSDLITPAQRASFQINLDTQEGKLGIEAGYLDLVDAGLGGIPLDPKDPEVKKAVDYGYLTMIRNTQPDQIEQAEESFINALNIVPDSVISRLRASANSDNPAIIERAAEQYARYKQASPQIDQEFTDSEIALLENVALDRTLGIDPAESVQRHRDVMRVDDPTKKYRIKQYEALQREEGTDADWLGNQDNFARVVKPFWPDSSVEIPDTWKARFSAEVQRQYIIDPNLDRARRRAYEKISSALGVSRVGATDQLMVLPPEIAYPRFGGDSQAITEQLRGDMEGASGVSDIERIVIGSDFYTPREKDPATGAPKPGYPIFELDENDTPIPIYDPTTGIQMRFYPNYEKSPAKQRQLEAIEKAKMKHEERLRWNAMTLREKQYYLYAKLGIPPELVAVEPNEPTVAEMFGFD